MNLTYVVRKQRANTRCASLEVVECNLLVDNVQQSRVCRVVVVEGEILSVIVIDGEVSQ